MSVRAWFSRIVSHPRVFDAQTAILGGKRLAVTLRPIAAHTTRGRAHGIVLDVGGGTASGHSLWPPDWTYISLDPDKRVVRRDASRGAIRRIVGDASCLAFGDDSVDVVMMKAVSHHLDDSTWLSALSEVRRILRPEGYFLFVDGVFSHERWISRLAWFADTGRFPRPSTELESAIATSFEVESKERMDLLHHSLVLVGRPHPALRGGLTERIGM
ncbi:MAG TPA: class I SAM-dependent methyltransferase [Acidimicrobiales bacterium]|nr:class I SAM-dependent methyltransferase [Acidimicrobiales bacterium]